MRFGTKMAIMLVAIVLTLVGFNLIISPSALELAKVGKQAGAEIIANYLAKVDVAAGKASSIKG